MVLIFFVQDKNVKLFILVNVLLVQVFNHFKIFVLKFSKNMLMVNIFPISKKQSNVFFFCLDVCHTHFHRLPYDIVKPILDSATPEQLNFIIDNNPVGRLRYFISK